MLERMKCEIVWQKQGPGIEKAKNATLLQDARYAQALAATSRLRPRRGLILVNGQKAGIVSIMEFYSLFGLLHGVTLDRGPAWLEGFGGAHHIKIFYDEFNRLFPARFGRKRRIIPEIEDSPVARKMLDSAGLVRTGEGYQTFILDLTGSAEERRARLAQKWRNVLNRSEREPLSVEWDDTARQLPWFLKVYEQDKSRKGYDGPAPDFLHHLASLMTGSTDMILGRAMKDGGAISAVLIACHGDSATYLAGWTGEAGRATGAHHRLLWEACGVLQQKGITQFDLGGFNEGSAKGIMDFKAGMGGRVYSLAGRYA